MIKIRQNPIMGCKLPLDAFFLIFIFANLIKRTKLMYELLCHNGKKIHIHNSYSIERNKNRLFCSVTRSLSCYHTEKSIGLWGKRVATVTIWMTQENQRKRKNNNHDEQLHGILHFMCWTFFFVICTLQINKCKNANTTSHTTES